MRRSFVVPVLGAVTILSALAPMARAAGGPQFRTPMSWGTVDFGDRVAYRLDGTGCERAQVMVRVGGGSRADAVGPTSRAVGDPLAPGSCIGLVNVPSEAAVRATGWDAGDPITVRIVTDHDEVPLRYQRIDVDRGTAAAGSPTAVKPAVHDPRAGARDAAMSMSSGDRGSLGRVDLTKIYSIFL